jgi:putative flippase GtrA
MIALPHRGVRYLGVSGCCALVNNGLLIGLDAVGLRALGSVLVSAAVMIPLAYMLHTRWTFGTVAERAGFLRYAAVSMLNLPMSALLVLLLRDAARLPMIVVAPTVTLGLFCLNLLGARWSIARQHGRPPSPYRRGRS